MNDMTHSADASTVKEALAATIPPGLWWTREWRDRRWRIAEHAADAAVLTHL